MGVLGLWSLLNTTQHPVTLELLEGKVLAIDASIWLNQALKSGNTSPNAHLHTLFFRLCKLLFFKIRPVFVFDGSAPTLKNLVLEKRRKQKSDSEDQARKARERILQNYLKKQAVKQSRLPKSPPVPKPIDEETNLFQLPHQNVSPEPILICDEEQSSDNEPHNVASDFMNAFPESEDVDFESEEFTSMPLEVQHEVVQDLIEYEKYITSHSMNPGDMPTDSAEFSNFQFSRMMRKAELTKRLEEIRSKMNHRDTASITSSLLRGRDADLVVARRIVSQDTGHAILIKGLTKDPEKPFVESSLVPGDVSSDTKMVKQTLAKTDDSVEGDTEFDEKERLDWLSQTDLVASNENTETVEESQELVDETEYEAIRKASSRLIEIESGGQAISISSSPKKKDYSDDYVLPLPFRAGETVISVSSSQSGASSVIVIADDPLPSSQNTFVHQISDSSDEDDDFIDVPNAVLDEEESLNPAESGQQIADFVMPETETSIAETCVNQPDVTHGSLFTASDLDLIHQNVDQWEAKVDAETNDLRQEVARHESNALTVSQRFAAEAQELLQLFGVPFVVSPQEAEAQCAHLEMLGLTDGSVTEDSDIWLFGGTRVYKHMFTQHKQVQYYNIKDIESVLGLSRSRLIGFAYLCGSDYATGVSTVGPVTAMEIMAEFPATSALESLKLFSDWLRSAKKSPLKSTNPVREKLLKLELEPRFPQEEVEQAYLHPIVDDSREKFSWGRPDLDLIRQYANKKLRWTSRKVDEALIPVLSRFDEHRQQTRITDFIQVSPSKTSQGSLNAAELTRADKTLQSQRLKRALNKLGSPIKPSDKSVETKSAEKNSTPTNHQQLLPGCSEVLGFSSSKSKNGPSKKRTKKASNHNRCLEFTKVSRTNKPTQSKKKKQGPKSKIVTEVQLSEESSLSSDADIEAFMRSIDTTSM